MVPVAIWFTHRGQEKTCFQAPFPGSVSEPAFAVCLRSVRLVLHITLALLYHVLHCKSPAATVKITFNFKVTSGDTLIETSPCPPQYVNL